MRAYKVLVITNELWLVEFSTKIQTSLCVLKAICFHLFGYKQLLDNKLFGKNGFLKLNLCDVNDK